MAGSRAWRVGRASMSMLTAAMAKELRESGCIEGLGGLSSAAWAIEVRDREVAQSDQRKAALSRARTGSDAQNG